MSLPDDFDADVEEIESDIAATMTYGGESYAIIRDAAAAGMSVGIAGWEPDVDLVVFVRLSLLADVTAPAQNSTVTIGGVVYRVKTATPDQAATLLRLDLKQEDG